MTNEIQSIRAGWFFAAILCIAQAFAGPPDYHKETNRFLSLFRAYNGQSLPRLLAPYGIRVDVAIPIPFSSSPALMRPQDGDRLDDTVWEINLVGFPSKPMPCGLSGEWSRDFWLSEIIQRGSTLRIQNQPAVGPLLYWAVTGHCSPDYPVN